MIETRESGIFYSQHLKSGGENTCICLPASVWYSGLCRLKIWWLTWVRVGTKGFKYPLCTWMHLRFYCLDPQKQKAFCLTEKTSIAFIYWLANFPAHIKKVYRLWTRGDSVDSSIVIFFCNNIRLVGETRRKRFQSSPPRRPDHPERRRRLPTAEASDLLRLIHAAVNQPRSDTHKEEARSVCCRADLLCRDSRLDEVGSWLQAQFTSGDSDFWFLTLLHDTRQLLQWFCLREAHVKRCTSLFPFNAWRGGRSEVERQQVLRSRQILSDIRRLEKVSTAAGVCLTNNLLKCEVFTELRF